MAKRYKEACTCRFVRLHKHIHVDKTTVRSGGPLTPAHSRSSPLTLAHSRSPPDQNILNNMLF